MRNFEGEPLICSGSMIYGVGHFGFMVDQTPVMVRDMLDGAEGLVEFTRDGVAVYVAADAPITAITPTFTAAPDCA